MTAAPAPAAEATFHAWNPGLEPGLPRALMPLATVFRPETTALPLPEILELADVSGLSPVRLAPIRAERLAVHELLIRVMADYSVPVGEVYADLGVNFRAMVATIWREGIAGRMAAVEAELEALRVEADAIIARELSILLDGPAEAPPPPPRRLFGLLPGRPVPVPAGDGLAGALARLDARCAEAEGLDGAVREALRSVVAAVIARQGTLIRDRALLARLSLILTANREGSRRIGALIEPWIAAAAESRGYRRLAAQAEPVVMTVKGASASGKSTIRPYQRDLAGRIGAAWSDFAVVTPDVWRKYLLDYDSLGPRRRYAGPLTGHEVEIVDAKLDRHITAKAAGGNVSHLLIDRFRFDSFSTEANGDGTGGLLTRFGQQVFLQFMVTPPEETVERAWKRGEEFGRYKAVEDLLAHNVEAYSGMPRLFFTWALRQDRAVFYEFLDNAVPKGARPLTIAFGTNGAMTILDARALLAIERYRRIDIRARGPEEVYRGAAPDPEQDAGFLRAILRRIATVRFAEPATGRVVARFEGGRLAGLDRPRLDALRADPARDPAMAEALAAAGLFSDMAAACPDLDETLCPESAATLGDWGAARG